MMSLYIFGFILFAITNTYGAEITCPSEGISFIPDPEDCGKYWECVDGNGFQFTCPKGLVWNPKTDKCDYPENVDECFTTNVSEPTTDGFTPNPLCPYPSDDLIFLPDPDDCSKFFECYEGILSVLQCEAGLLWNQEKETCDYPENVDCDGSGSGSGNFDF